MTVCVLCVHVPTLWPFAFPFAIMTNACVHINACWPAKQLGNIAACIKRCTCAKGTHTFKQGHQQAPATCRMRLRLLSPMQYAFGRTLGNWILLPPQLIVLVGLGITYT